MAFAALLAAGCPLEPSEPCITAGCNDQNPCTIDVCDPELGCRFEPATAGSDCDDGDACNGVDGCDASGSCVAGTPPSVDDGDGCTEDACDPLTGVVSHEPVAGCTTAMPGWQPLAAEGRPSARALHTAVWTGERMIVWGGSTSIAEVAGDGASYDPASDGWLPVTQDGAPSARHSHTVVWTGSEMIVWGGYGESGYAEDGARYDPATDSWQPLAAAPIEGRTRHGAVWSGSEMIVFGGLRGATTKADGARYHPASDTWTLLDQMGAPSGRLSHVMAWAGGKLVVWGGTDTFDWLGDGKYYQDGWLGPVASAGAPSFRESATGLYDGSGRLIVWGGWNGGPYLNDGALLDPAGDGWTPMSDAAAPSPRAGHVSVWTGSELYVWGGCGGEVCGLVRDDGGRYQPGPTGGSWIPVAADAAFEGRVDASAVWTGAEVIVFGGRRENERLDSAARTTLP